MPRTQIPVTGINRAGVAPPAGTAADPVNLNFVVNDGETWLSVRNTDTGSRTVTINLATTVDGQTITPRSYSIGASATRLIGPFPVSQYGAQLQVDADTALVTVIAYRLED